jgi:16S rRNA (guanine1207-N2)-methyltransferase
MNTGSDTPSGSHYFSERPSRDSRRGAFVFAVGDTTLTVSTDAGVFSQHGLDKGTRVFLDTMLRRDRPVLAPGDVLCDLGCGSGAIALTLAVLYPQCRVLAVDVNERARQLCAENARSNNLDNVTVISPDEFDNDTQVTLLWSNPPIRIGKDALHDLLSTWLSRLVPRGMSHLVVGKNLGADSLTSWLNDIGYHAAKIASSKGFRVLEVCRTQ